MKAVHIRELVDSPAKRYREYLYLVEKEVLLTREEIGAYKLKLPIKESPEFLERVLQIVRNNDNLDTIEVYQESNVDDQKVDKLVRSVREKSRLESEVEAEFDAFLK